MRWRDLGKLTLYGLLENFCYRQMNTWWRVKVIVSFLRKNTEWGDMERKGFEADKVKEIAPQERSIIAEKGEDPTMRRYLRPKRQAPEPSAEVPATTPAQAPPQETPTPAEREQPEESVKVGVQLEEVEQLGEVGQSEERVEEDERLEGTVTVTSEYIAKLERESEDANNLILDLGEFVERVDVLRDKLKEDARRISELRERLEQDIAEVNALRSQIEEDTSRVDELIR